MACTHLGPIELMELAEKHLRENAVGDDRWNGLRFAYVENVDQPKIRSVYTEIERRGDQWIVTAIDRRPDPAPESDTGLKML